MTKGLSDETVPLPPWFERPRPELTRQLTLFAAAIPEVLASLRVSTNELARWHNQGWKSFGSERTSELQPWDVGEIQFVRDVVRSGLADAQIERLFAELPRPMNFDPDAVAYSFSLGWVAAMPPEPEADPIEVVDEHLDDWLADLDVDANQGRLIEIRDRINTLLASIETPDESELP